MDNQGSASSLLVNIVPKHPRRQENASKLWKNALSKFLLNICEEKF
jgi:hypothetical protein